MGTPQSFWQTLLAAKSELSRNLIGTTALMDVVFADVKPVESALGQTLDIPVPQSVLGSVVISGTNAADPTFNSYNVPIVPISLDTKLQVGHKLPSFDQYSSPVAIKDVLLEPAINAVAMAANAQIATLLNSTNFNVNQVVATTGSAVTPDQFVNGGFTPLLNQLVNVQDPNQMAFVQHPNVYAKQLRNPDWSQESLVGINVAQQAKVEGGIKVAYGAKQMVDQQMPASGAAPNQTFTSWYGTKYSIATVYRPLPAGDKRVVDVTYIYYKGLPIKVEFGYNVVTESWYLNIGCGMGKKVVRPEQGVIFSTAQ